MFGWKKREPADWRTLRRFVFVDEYDDEVHQMGRFLPWIYGCLHCGYYSPGDNMGPYLYKCRVHGDELVLVGYEVVNYSRW